MRFRGGARAERRSQGTALARAFALVWLAAGAGSVSAQRLELIREIGSSDGDPDYTFFRIGEVEVDGRGDVWVLDTGDKALRVYDSTGRFRLRIGREGSGPGEFMLPTQLQLGPEDIRVVDARLFRFSRFDHAGRHLETAALTLPAGMRASGMYPLRGGSTLVRTLYRASPGSEDHDPYVHAVVLGADGSVQDTLSTWEPAVVIWYTPGQKAPWGGVATGLGDGGALAVSGDSLVALVDGILGRVVLRRMTVCGLGSPAAIDLGVRGEEFPRRLLNSIQDSIRRTLKDTRIVVTGPVRLSAITGQAFFAPDGELWIELATDAPAEREWLRIRPATGSIARVRVPRALALRGARDSRVYGVWRDALDVQTVRVYRLVDSEALRMHERPAFDVRGDVLQHAGEPLAGHLDVPDERPVRFIPVHRVPQRQPRAALLFHERVEGPALRVRGWLARRMQDQPIRRFDRFDHLRIQLATRLRITHVQPSARFQGRQLPARARREPSLDLLRIGQGSPDPLARGPDPDAPFDAYLSHGPPRGATLLHNRGRGPVRVKRGLPGVEPAGTAAGQGSTRAAVELVAPFLRGQLSASIDASESGTGCRPALDEMTWPPVPML